MFMVARFQLEFRLPAGHLGVKVTLSSPHTGREAEGGLACRYPRPRSGGQESEFWVFPP